MCMFSRPVDAVLGTNIFARSVNGDRQVLVYSMTIAARNDLAMILPLPVPPGTPEDAVRFINLEGYPGFFSDLEKGFPMTLCRSAGAQKALVVHDVGSFEASFVPSLADFERLDERFRLPATAWHQLPSYKDYGFAVFKLKRGEKTIHPMAFEFPRRRAGRLFFPTVHVHDGQVHPEADFDHALFYQFRGESPEPGRIDQTERVARHFMDTARAQGIIDPNQICCKIRLFGPGPNEDTWIGEDR
jgi:hypothetical protein